MSRVVVCFYSGRWIPIMFCPLVEAIALHQNALKEGKEIFIFPHDCDPNNFFTEIAYDFSTEITYMQPPALGEAGGLTNLAILKRCDQSQPIAN
ncbi:hypothetical protein [Coleofasciculus sp. FACHB-1120]|uniref:hypothetical protein n=1 Tax=Coleofasciculus sp. FACHB-1120 TaxID=2692783 RepID=UPI00199C19E4|nr:hypothetical protein [Coleofasciculus sp. FACHB-1120]MBD2744020.1 hypothetical protein [Coleofasciculus sp. FACHB-1120]